MFASFNLRLNFFKVYQNQTGMTQLLLLTMVRSLPSGTIVAWVSSQRDLFLHHI